MRNVLAMTLVFACLACSPAAEPEDATESTPGSSAAGPAPTQTAPTTAKPATRAIGPDLAPVDTRREKDPQHNAGKKLRGLYNMNIRDARLDPVITGLSKPWAFEFIDENNLLITELDGRLYWFQVSPARLDEIPGLPDIATQEVQTGLLDIEIHPEFSQNHRIYFSYTEADPESGRYYQTVVATAIIKDRQLVEVESIVTAGPYGWSPSNFGGAIEFDDQGHLYVTIGDRSEREQSQRGDRLQGKVLRLNDDGSVPTDNPFVNDPDIDDRIYALGVRNPQGLHFDAASGLLFETEHGPRGGDEVNIIEAGANYGWPIITYGNAYSGEPMGSGTHQDGLRQPLWFYLPSIATSPITVYRGDMFPEWDGDLLVGGLRGKTISRLVRDDRVIRSEFRFMHTLNARMRDVKVAKDGAIWALIEFGGLYRLSRDPKIADTAGKAASGKGIYNVVCAGCHDTGAYGAPRPGDAKRWSKISQKPRDVIDRNVAEGLGAMPPRGMCNFCTDEHLRLVTDYMLGTVED